MTRPEAHDTVRHDLGAYVLGALPPDERSRVEQHVQTCGTCRREVADLAALPGLLGRVDTTTLTELDDTRPPSGLGAATVAIGHRRRRTRRVRSAVAGLVVAAGFAAIALAGGVGEPKPDLELAVAESTAPAEVTGTARVEGRDWGMTIDLDLDGLPGDGGYVLWAVARDGHRTQAASWSATPEGTVRLQGSCYLALDRLDRLEVTTPADDVVAVLTVP